MDALLLINPRAGDNRPTADELRAAAESRGIRTHVVTPGEDMRRAAQTADASVLGVAGGDGSLGPVARVALERELAFVCVPLGTRNHFARDIGLDPDDPLGALDEFEGAERRIDIGRINGRVFLNNVSLGLYAQLVHERRRRALTTLRALFLVARHPRPLHLTIDGELSRARAVVVANNAYRLDPLTIGKRERIDEGLLYVYEAPGLLPTTWSERSADEVRIEARGTIRAAIDGEAVRLDPPLDFRIEPSALRVLCPRKPG
jgi:diacylglycerol kinase family enzyme